MHFYDVLTLAMEVKSRTITHPSLVGHSCVICLALAVNIWPRETNEMMLLAEVDTI